MEKNPDLSELLSIHKEAFKQRFIEALAKNNSMETSQVRIEFKDFIEEFVDGKYIPISRLIQRINENHKPVFLNIRRDRMREDKCKICEGNEPSIHALQKKYGDSIEIFEVVEDRAEGALYQIIFHEEALEKKLPLTAIINKGKLIRFWAGKTVDASVYERYINKYLA